MSLTSEKRNAVRLQILNRTIGLSLICPVCGEPIRESGKDAVMHEVILFRSDVQSLAEHVKIMIFTKYNCVFLHNQCHVLAQSEQWAKDRCASFLVIYEGENNILDWLSDMLPYMTKGRTVRDAISYVKGIGEQLWIKQLSSSQPTTL